MLRLSEHFEAEGNLILQHACRLGLEGIVSKLRDCALSVGTQQGLAQGEMLGAPGVRRVRLCSLDDLAQGDRLARARHIIPTASSSMRAGSAPASPWRSPRIYTGGSSRIRIASSPFAERLSADAARAGPLRASRNWWPRSSSAAGPRTATCGTPLFAACARTSRQTRSWRRRLAWPHPARHPPKRPQPELMPRRQAAPRRSSSPIPIALYWPDVGVTKEGLADYYTQVWRSHRALRRPVARSPWCAARAASPENASSRNTPGKG